MPQNCLALEKRGKKKEKKKWSGLNIMHQNKLDSLKQESGKAFLLGNFLLHSICKSNKVWSLIFQVTVNC